MTKSEIDEILDLGHTREMEEKKKASKIWLEGSINWYDPHSGRGSIIGDDGIWYRIHEFVRLQGMVREGLKEKTRIQFELARDSIHPIIRTVREARVTKSSAKRSKFKSYKPSKDSSS